MDVFGALYHWSPVERRQQILQEGLKVYSEPVTHTGSLCYPYVCFGVTPSAAWGLSGDIFEDEEYAAWDLWQYRVRESDSVRVRPDFGPRLQEVRIQNSIPAGELWWVATREGLCAVEKPKPKRKPGRKK